MQPHEDLPPPLSALVTANAVAPAEFQQVISASFHQEKQTFIVAGKITAEYIKLMALTPAGLPMFTITHRQQNTQLEKHLPLPAQVDPYAILQDLQLVFWPAASLDNALDVDWKLAQKKHKRIFTYQNTPGIEIQYATSNPWQGEVTLDNHLLGYQLFIKTLEYVATP